MNETDVKVNRAPPRTLPVVPGFEVLKLANQDQLGARYRARERSTGLVRTVRVVRGGLTSRQKVDLKRLWRALLHRSLDPFLTTVVDHGATADGSLWVATDENAEVTLASQLTSGWRPSPPEVERIASLAASALRALHEDGLTHGGISPTVIVREGDSWRLTDVGITSITTPMRLGGVAAEVGEVTAYAAPEVLAGASPTAAADIYALAITIAEALSGGSLVWWEPGETAATLLRRRPSEPPVLAHEGDAAVLLDFITAAWRREPERRPTAVALRELLETSGADQRAAAAQPAPIRVIDDDVQFTAYRPHAVEPERWYTMLAFAHKTDSIDPDFGPPDPLQEVKRQAKAVLGEDFERYVTAAEDSSSVIERGSELTFVPHMEGVEFNPPQSSFQWVEAVHREEFRLRAARSLDGRRARGRLSVFVGTLLVADVNLTMWVDSARAADLPAAGLQRESARPYRKIFASYSHSDHVIVQHVGILAKSLGDEFIRDCSHLRAGEVWSDQLENLIRQADVFQLFWSSNSITSPFVRQEWEYALSLGRPYFVRPCYWEEPLPARPEQNLPPETLQRLHFQQLAFSSPGGSSMAPTAPGEPSAPPSPPPPSAGASAEVGTTAPPPSSLPRSPEFGPPSGSGSAGSTTTPLPDPSRSHRWTAALTGLASVAVLVLALGAVHGLRGPGDEKRTSTAPRPPLSSPIEGSPHAAAPGAAPSPSRPRSAAPSPSRPSTPPPSPSPPGEAAPSSPAPGDAAPQPPRPGGAAPTVPASGSAPVPPRPSGAVKPSELTLDVPQSTLKQLSSELGVQLEPPAAACTQGDAGACQLFVDTLTEGCADGSGLACDVLWEVSPPNSTYERYGATCGGRADGTFAGECEHR